MACKSPLLARAGIAGANHGWTPSWTLPDSICTRINILLSKSSSSIALARPVCSVEVARSQHLAAWVSAVVPPLSLIDGAILCPMLRILDSEPRLNSRHLLKPITMHRQSFLPPIALRSVFFDRDGGSLVLLRRTLDNSPQTRFANANIIRDARAWRGFRRMEMPDQLL